MCEKLQSQMKIKLTDHPFESNQFWLPLLSKKGNMINLAKSAATGRPSLPYVPKDRLAWLASIVPGDIF